MKQIILSTLILLANNIWAQKENVDSLKNKELEAITIIGSKSKSIPGAGQYISSRKLEQLNQPNINNVLRIVPGVNIRDEEGFGLRPNIGLRGTPVNRSAKITLMEDGVLIAPAPYADPSAYYFPTFARMQGVEVLKGSSQIKYGPYTIGGAINLLSTKIPNSFTGFAQLSYGSFNTNQQRVWVGDSRKNFDYLLELSRLASTGFKELDNGGNTGFDRRDVLAKVRWHTDNKAKLQQAVTLKFVNTSEKGNETYLGLTYDDYQKNRLRRYAGTQKDILDLNHKHASLQYAILPAKGVSINATAYFAKTFRDWARANAFGGQSVTNTLNNTTTAQQAAYNIMTGQANGDIEHQSAARTYFSKGVNVSTQYTFYTKKVTHKLQLGIRAHADEADRYATKSTYKMDNSVMTLVTQGITGNQENQIRNAKSFATFVSYDLEYKNLKISPGVRHETIHFDFENYGTNDNPRTGTALKTATNHFDIYLPGLGVNYQINREMDIFGGVHKGFSPPGMPSTATTTTQAKAETSINYELGLRLDKTALHIQSAAFINNYDNILGSDNISGGGAGTGNMFNAGNAIIKGVELTVSYDLLYQKGKVKKYKLPFTVAYTYTDARFQETFVNGGGDWGSGTINKGDFIPFITPHLLTASIALENKRFDASIVGRYTSATRTKPGQGAVILPAQNTALGNVNSLEEFLIVDFSANYKINKMFTAYTLINNVTNTKAIVANLPQSYRPNMPLSFSAGVKINF